MDNTSLKSKNFKVVYTNRCARFTTSYATENKTTLDDPENTQIYNDIASLSEEMWEQMGMFTTFWLSFFAYFEMFDEMLFIINLWKKTCPSKINQRDSRTDGATFWYPKTPNYSMARTILGYAVEFCSMRVVSLLLQHGASPNSEVEIFRGAIRSKNLDLIKLMITHNCKYEKDSYSILFGLRNFMLVPAHWVCALNTRDLNIVKFFFDLPNGKNINRNMCLAYVIQFAPSEEIARFLLDNGADPNAYFKRKYCRNDKYVRRTELNAKRGYDDDYYGSRRTIDNSDDSGDDYSDDESETPLHMAVYRDNITIASLLLQRGANVNAGFISNNTFEGESTIDENPEDEYTALHYAVMRKNIEMVKLLLLFNAKVNIENGVGHTPIDLAKNHQEILVLLLETQTTQGTRRITIRQRHGDYWCEDEDNDDVQKSH
jgi:hypothetical protein